MACNYVKKVTGKDDKSTKKDKKVVKIKNSQGNISNSDPNLILNSKNLSTSLFQGNNVLSQIGGTECTTNSRNNNFTNGGQFINTTIYSGKQVKIKAYTKIFLGLLLFLNFGVICFKTF